MHHPAIIETRPHRKVAVVGEIENKEESWKLKIEMDERNRWKKSWKHHEWLESEPPDETMPTKPRFLFARYIRLLDHFIF